MRSLSLFSGIGAASIAVDLHFGSEVIGFCEQDAYAQKVLRRHWPDVPIYDDVCDIGAHNLPAFDILEAGFPCQDLSTAGRQAGMEEGTRSGLFYEVIRIAQECKPRFVFCENVPALLSKYRGAVERAFADIGYGVTWAKVGACHVGAPHRRLRVFVLAELGKPHRGVCDAGPVPELGAWPTPSAMNPNDGQDPVEYRARLARMKERHNNGNGAGVVLAQAVQPWSSPVAADGDKDRGHFGNPSIRRRMDMGKQVTLDMQVRGKLNPAWVEALQGIPVGFTEPQGEVMRGRGEARAIEPWWPAPMIKGMWGDSPQYSWEPPRAVTEKVPNRSARLRCLGNCNPPALYLRALEMLAEGPRQATIFGLGA